MQCPYCSGDSAVLDSRTSSEGVRRRRSCNECKRRFTTYERLAAPSIRVTKRSGRTEPFNSEKILQVIRRVSRDRSAVDDTDVVRLTRTLEAQLVDDRVKTVRSAEIAARVLDLLRDLDRLSYDRLAANYMDEGGQLRLEPSTANSDDGGQLGLFRGDD